MRTVRFLWRVLVKFDQDRGLFLASGIAFQVLLCLVPLVLLLLAFVGTYFMTDDLALVHFGRNLDQAAPTLDPTVRRDLLGILGRRGTFGVVGTVGLLWIATTLFGWLRIALNTIFRVAEPKGTIGGLVQDLGMILLSGVAFLGSVALTGFVEYLQRMRAPLFPAATGRLLSFTLSYLLPFLAILLIGFLLYRLVPNRTVRSRDAFLGALFTGVLWEAAKHLFTWYVAATGSYSLVYGSLSAVVVLLVWTYYSAAVLLLGAEVAALLGERPQVRGAADAPEAALVRPASG